MSKLLRAVFHYCGSRILSLRACHALRSLYVTFPEASDTALRSVSDAISCPPRSRCSTRTASLRSSGRLARPAFQMHLIIAHDPNDVQRALKLNWQARLHQLSNVSVQVVSLFTLLL